MTRPSTELEFSVGKKVLVLGKGPSLTQENFARANEKGDAIVIGINQVSAHFKVDIAFFVDFEPYEEIKQSLLKDKHIKVLLPWRPNKRIGNGSRSKPMIKQLDEMCSEDEILARLSEERRLFYFHTFYGKRNAGMNCFTPNLVSLTALLKILAGHNVINIATLGIDGGRSYSSILNKSSTVTQLKNGYDKQFPIIKDIAIKHGMTIEKADMETLNIYVGCEEQQKLPAKLLEYSIKKHTNRPVRVINLYEVIKADNRSGRTPFSLQRFHIPKLNNYAGIAVYLDSDMLVYRDIEELLAQHQSGSAVSCAEAPPGSNRRPQFSVMVIDCSLARWNAEEIASAADKDYESVLFNFGFEKNISRCISYKWNSLELLEPDTGLVHFTDMDIQPWIATSNKLTESWMSVLIEAVENNYISFDDIVEQVKLGWLRPGLLYQLEFGVANPARMPKHEKLKDNLFTPPHTVARFTKHNNIMSRVGLAVAKRIFHKLKRSTSY